MGSESWINLVKSLKEKFGSAADSILHAEGIPAGEAMATRGIERRVDERVKEDDAGKRTIAKLENLKALFKATGFGVLEILGNAERFHVTIGESMAAKQDLIDNFVGVEKGLFRSYFRRSILFLTLNMMRMTERSGFNLTARSATD